MSVISFSRLGVIFCLVILLFSQTIDAQTQDPNIELILSNMTLEHKVAQMFMVNLYGNQLTYTGREMLETWQPGAVVLLDSNIATPVDVARLTNSYQQTITDAGGVPLFVATDQEGGIIARLKEGFTTWPVPMLITAANNPDLAYQYGAGMARELRAVGVNMNLAPVADLQTNLANPIINRRSPGSDIELVSNMITNFVQGSQDAGVMTTLKHFPGHGDTSDDSHTTLPVLRHTSERLYSVELPSFMSGIDAGSGAVMVAHIWFPEFDAEVIPASLSENIVTGLLREDLKYDGIIMTDAMDMDAIDTQYSPEESAVLAVQAGIDLIIIGANAGEAIQARAMQAVVDAVHSGKISEAQIDASVYRILEAKARFGILVDWMPVDLNTVEQNMGKEKNTLLIEEVFREGVTVAFDKNNIIPFGTDSQIGIIFPGNRVQIQRECSMYSDHIRWLAVSDNPSDDEVRGAVSLASQVSTIVIFTHDAYTNTSQQALVNALPLEKSVVVALISPYDWLRFPQISTYIVTYSPLEPAVPAACGILFGEYPANGKLAVTLESPSN